VCFGLVVLGWGVGGGGGGGGGGGVGGVGGFSLERAIHHFGLIKSGPPGNRKA